MISKAQIKRGMDVEMEHTRSRRVARKIALDHLREDPRYYTKLAKCFPGEHTLRRTTRNPEIDKRAVARGLWIVVHKPKKGQRQEWELFKEDSPEQSKILSWMHRRGYQIRRPYKGEINKLFQGGYRPSWEFTQKRKSKNPRRRKRNSTSYRWLSKRTIQKWKPLAAKLGVSKVARSSRGFLSAYARAGYKVSKLPERWRRKRSAFIKRHMAQVKKRREKLWKNGKPTRRHLALMMWAYSPGRKSSA